MIIITKMNKVFKMKNNLMKLIAPQINQWNSPEKVGPIA